MASIDLTGKRFGRLVVIERSPRSTSRLPRWICRCDCGVDHDTRASSLTSQCARSCGCLAREASTARNGKHWGSRDCTTATEKKLYSVWTGVRRRCLYPKTRQYPDYGGRGITICDEWAEYPAFKDWSLANGYEDGKSIDRIDVNGGYSPENCRWTGAREQARNRRNTRYVRVNGLTVRLQDLNEAMGVSHPVMLRKLRDGRPFEKAAGQLIMLMRGHWDGEEIITPLSLKVGKDGVEISDNAEPIVSGDTVKIEKEGA